MLKSQGLEAFPDSVPLFRVFICAHCRPQMNTLKFYTQSGVPLVPCPVLFPTRKPPRF